MGMPGRALVNDGWQDLEYELTADPVANARLSKILNEACHVFHLHAEGVWASHDRDAYAEKLRIEIGQRPSLVRKLLALRDRVVRMLVYRAVELKKEERLRG